MVQSTNLPEISQDVLDRLRELTPVPNPTRRKQLEKYQSLPPTERELLQLLSIIYTQVARSVLIQCMAKAGIQVGNTKTSTIPVLDYLLKRLVADGLISDTKTYVRCFPGIAEVLTREAIGAGRFEAMAEE